MLTWKIVRIILFKKIIMIYFFKYCVDVEKKIMIYFLNIVLTWKKYCADVENCGASKGFGFIYI